MSAFIAALTALFPLMNPVGNTPIFFSITAGDSPAFRRRIALKTAIKVLIILTVCLLGGKYIYKWHQVKPMKCQKWLREQKPSLARLALKLHRVGWLLDWKSC